MLQRNYFYGQKSMAISNPIVILKLKTRYRLACHCKLTSNQVASNTDALWSVHTAMLTQKRDTIAAQQRRIKRSSPIGLLKSCYVCHICYCFI